MTKGAWEDRAFGLIYCIAVYGKKGKAETQVETQRQELLERLQRIAAY